MKTLTIAEKVSDELNASRIMEHNADVGFETALNTFIADVKSVTLHKRVIFFKDGSILTVLDTTISREVGIAKFNYSFLAQDKLC